MRKGRDWEKKKRKKKREKNGEKKEKTDENSGHYVIASSRPPDRWNAAHSRQYLKLQLSFRKAMSVFQQKSGYINECCLQKSQPHGCL